MFFCELSRFHLDWRGSEKLCPPFPCEVENLSLYIETPPSNYKASVNSNLSVCRPKVFSADESWTEKKIIEVCSSYYRQELIIIYYSTIEFE